MNATLIDGGKVHRLNEGVARCGVGRNSKARGWQMEMGVVTCLRCVKLEKPKTKPVLTTNGQSLRTPP